MKFTKVITAACIASSVESAAVPNLDKRGGGRWKGGKGGEPCDTPKAPAPVPTTTPCDTPVPVPTTTPCDTPTTQ
ncbi:hypothetical protein MGO_05293, partial [Candida albicans P76055]